MVIRANSLLQVLCYVPVLWLVLCGNHVSGRLFAGEPQGDSPVSRATALLRSNCFSCHGEQEAEADFRLDLINTNFQNDPVTAEKWQRVLDAIRDEAMPPPDAKQLTADERRWLVNWVDGEIQQYVKSSSVTRPPRRKLTRVEYQNTMRDLLGIEMDFARDLPADPISPDGFTNDSRLLELTPVHLDAYLDSARNALQRVIVSHARPAEFHHRFERSNVSAWHGETHISSELGRQQQFLARIESAYPEQGEFLVRVSVSVELMPHCGFPLLEVAVGYRPDTQILFREFPVVEISTPGEQVYEFRGNIQDFPLPVRGQGKFPGLVVRLRNTYDDGSPLPKGVKTDGKKLVYPAEPHLPLLRVQSVEFHGPVFDTWPPAQHANIVTEIGSNGEPKRSDVRQIVTRFAQRAFRRPLSNSELRSLMKFYSEVRSDFPKFEDALRETLAFILIQPGFLFVPGTDQTQADNGKSENGKSTGEDNWVLASRLSYFLWSSMPDARLFDLAANGLLSQPEILQAEVERMLRNPKSSAFFEQFADQWLGLDLIQGVEVNKDFYPHFDAALKTEMVKESREFFAEMVRSNYSAQDFILADFSMLNESLARHYGIEGVLGNQLRRVRFPPSHHRGGLLGQAGFLLAGSTGTDSHPVRRAVWIRDRLLNDPPRPPPANVPGLDAIDSSFQQLSVREKLEVHRHDPTCASCHQDLDPWGIALENFDAVGLWREELRVSRGEEFVKSPIVAKDIFSDGFELAGPEQLKERLGCDLSDRFARSVLSRLLTYALGRPLDVMDHAATLELEKQFADSGYRMRDLLKIIVASDLFRGSTFGRNQHDR